MRAQPRLGYIPLALPVGFSPFLFFLRLFTNVVEEDFSEVRGIAPLPSESGHGLRNTAPQKHQSCHATTHQCRHQGERPEERRTTGGGQRRGVGGSRQARTSGATRRGGTWEESVAVLANGMPLRGQDVTVARRVGRIEHHTL